MSKDNLFLGRGWAFPPTFKNTEQTGVVMVSKEEDIKQSLEILMNTSKGERIMLPDYGSDLHDFLFDSISNSNLHLLQDIIKTAILRYEPRIRVNDILIDHEQYLDGIIKIEIDYTIETTNTRFNLVFPYYKVEGTDIPQLFHKQIVQKRVEE